MTRHILLDSSPLGLLSNPVPGVPTGDPKKLDIDVILCAQALTMAIPAADIIVATANVSRISRFVSADLWTNIKPQPLETPDIASIQIRIALGMLARLDHAAKRPGISRSAFIYRVPPSVWSEWNSGQFPASFSCKNVF